MITTQLANSVILGLFIGACSKEEAAPSPRESRDELNGQQVITQEEAIAFTRAVVRTSGLVARTEVIGETFTSVDDNGMPKVHVVNYDAGGNVGWVMVSGDERITPLLGYGFDEAFSVEFVSNGGIDLTYEGYGDAVVGIRTGELDSSTPPYDPISYAPVPCRSDADSPDGNGNCVWIHPPLNCADPGGPSEELVGPLTTTTWSQDCPYNSRLPGRAVWPCEDRCGENRALVGCGAVAVAQVVNAWGFPNAFDWDNMQDFYDTDPAARALANQGGNVAELMRRMAQECNSVLGCNDTPTLPIAIPPAFRNMGYASGGVEIDYDWRVVRDELREGRPVIMHGRRTRIANWHIWVIDGFRVIENGWCGPRSWQRMNWGWNRGRGNGMYVIGDWLPKENVTGQPDGNADGNVIDTDRNYSNYRKIIVGISPN